MELVYIFALMNIVCFDALWGKLLIAIFIEMVATRPPPIILTNGPIAYETHL